MDKAKEIEEINDKDDLVPKKIPGHSAELSLDLGIAKLYGLSELMLSFDEDACGIEHKGIHGIGLMLQDILHDLREVREIENWS